MRQFYETRAAEFDRQAEDQARRVNVLSNVRLGIVIIAVVLLAVVWPNEPRLTAVVLVATSLFIFIVRLQRAARERQRGFELRAQLCRFGLLRADRDWHQLPIVLHAGNITDHPYAEDLDLFGRASVTQLFGPVKTLHGQRTLRDWLLQPAPLSQINERQAAIRTLARDIEFRESLTVEALRIDARSQRRLERFLEWVVADDDVPMTTPFIALIRFLPATTVALMMAQSSGVVTRAWWLLPFAATSMISVFGLRRVYQVFNRAFTDEPAPLAYAGVFQAAQAMPRDTPTLQRLHDQLNTKSGSAAQSIKRLERIMHLSDVRRSGITALIVELWFMWSFHVAVSLQRWRNEARSNVRSWFEALGELEALSSIATMAHDHPEWAFPTVASDASKIEAEHIGHPMLPDDKRVHNDVVVGPSGALLLITGSNMSGKSTLLRALGVNAVLAQAGAPACARQLRMPPVRIYSSVNVHDSIANGVSLYMAQLRRLQQIVQAADRATVDEPVFYLLDEILSGTNSQDRTAGVRAIIHHLTTTTSFGVLATHDLALVADEQIQRAATFVHFVDTFDSNSGKMSFDYRMRSGPVERSNALELMRMMGLPVD
jgi:hypothetical protein